MKHYQSERSLYDTTMYYHTCFLKYFLVITCAIISCALYCQQANAECPCKQKNQGVHNMATIQVTSSAFEHEGTIPSKYTCDGEDISPPLAIAGVPGNAKSLALICDDPDAPGGTWVHWVVFNLPATVKSLPEKVDIAVHGAIEGKNSWQKSEYGGPCPPSGTHRYYFKFYALDIATLDLDQKATKEDVLAAMEGHIVVEGQLMGKYSRAQ